MTSVFGFQFSTSDWRFLLLALLLFAGCLPHSCGRSGSRALLPADSLSRQAASAVPLDTLQRAWQTSASDSVRLRLPRTAMFLPGEGGTARLAVSDAERGTLLFFSGEGRLVRTMAPEPFAAPYLIGRRIDTLLVLSPEPRRVSFVAGGRVVRNQTLALPPVEEAPLLWASASGAAFFAKAIDDEGRSAVTRHGRRGQVTARRTLPGPRWHHAGPLLRWRDSLASLSGFRPVARRLPPDLSGFDTLRLAGFDSPMFPRSRRFAEGNARQPPLLMPDAATTDRLLFVLNLRPGRLRIDAFGPSGRLVGRLVAPSSAQSQDVYPRALAARRRPDGSYQLAVGLTAPRPAVALYHWRPATAHTASARR